MTTMANLAILASIRPKVNASMAPLWCFIGGVVLLLVAWALIKGFRDSSGSTSTPQALIIALLGVPGALLLIGAVIVGLGGGM